VATYDSAYLHMDKMGERFGLIIFDEAHHLPSRTTREAALMCTARARLGLTATPERADGKHTDLVALVGPTVFRLSMPDVAGRSLAEYDVVRVPVTLTAEEQVRYDAACAVLRQHLAERRRDSPGYTFEELSRESGTDPAARAAQKAYYARKSMEDRAAEKLRVLEDILSLHAGERVLVFTGSNAMAMEISRRFLVPTLLSFSRKKERQAVLAGFANGAIPVLVANQVLDEGVDIPECKVAVVLGGMSSVRQAKQRLGRILRRSGGQKATLYEVVTRDTGEEQRSRDRRRSDAYGRARQSTL
jgi:superfamily II DNA or RNA helicase